ncbi:MAG: sigma-70 family RNA polymerase sigma factor [Planctomycetota bacterium]
MTSIPQRDPQELLQHEPFVRELARLLVGDRQQAEDLAQDAWVAALEAGPAPMHSQRGWLATVLQRLAGKQRRAAARRRQREGVVAAQRPDRAPSVDELLEREHARAAVVKAVLALPDAYRDVVVLRWFEGLPPRDVAKRLGVPVETVRTRHRRAFERLREELDAQHGGDRAAWFAALAPLADASLVAGVATTTLLGGLLMLSMKTKLLTVAAAVVVIGLGTWAMSPPMAAPSPGNGGGGAVVAATAHALELERQQIGGEQPTTQRTAVAAATTVAASAPALDTGSLTVAVRWSDGTPAEGVAVHLFCGMRAPRPRAFSDRDGMARFPSLLATRYVVAAERGDLRDPRPLKVVVEVGIETRIELTLPDGVDLNGVVVDDHAVPIADAEVVLVGGVQRRQPVSVARTDSDGRFTARDVYCEGNVGARAEGHAPSLLQHLTGSVGGSLEVNFVLRRGAASLSGVVLAPDGSPVTDVDLLLEQASLLAARPSGLTGTQSPRYEPLRSDEHGRFDAEGLAPGTLTLVVETPDHPSHRETFDVRAGERTELTIRIPAGVTVLGVARRSDGSAVRDLVTATCEGLEVSDETGQDGSFVLHNVRAGHIDLRLGRMGAESLQHAVDAAPGASVRWDPVLPVVATLRGRVVDHEGKPVVGAYVTASHNGGEWGKYVNSDAQGQFVVPGCAPGVPVFLSVDNGGRQDLRFGPFPPGADEVLLTLPRPTAFTVRGVVVDAAGDPMANVSMWVRHSGGHHDSVTNRPDGSFELGPYGVGELRIEFRITGFATTKITRTLTDDVAADLGEVRLLRGGQLRARLLGADPQVAPQTSVSLADGSYVRNEISAEGVVTAGPLPPGDHLLHLRGPTICCQLVPFTIRDGIDTVLDVPVTRGTPTTITFAAPAGEPAPAYLRLKLLDAVGTARLDTNIQGGDGATLRTMLPPGRYRVEASGDNRLLHTLGCAFELDVTTEAIERTVQLTPR